MFIKLLSNFFLILAVFLPCRTLSAVEIIPANITQFYLSPGKKSILKFSAKQVNNGQTLRYQINNYSGNKIKNGQAATATDGTLQVELGLDNGFYELKFDACPHIFGIVCLPNCQSPPDGFFCIDGGLSWSKWPLSTRKTIIKRLLAKGISGFRERLSWPDINPANGENSFSNSIYDQIRREGYGTASGSRVLELIQDAPSFLYRIPGAKFSLNLPQAWTFWNKMETSTGKYWHAFEVWNEPFNVVPVPADQYLPVLKTISAALNEKNTGKTRIVAGCFSTSVPTSYLKSCAENGFFKVIDTVSLHLYGEPEKVLGIIKFFRNWEKKYHSERLPVCISESGTPWMTNAARLPSYQEATRVSAIQTMRGIEAMACGVCSYYAFYLQPYVEGTIGWGMTAGNGTPLRSLAAWLYAAQRLQGKKYLGDLVINNKLIDLARVFGDDKETVAVLYSKKGGNIKLNFPVTAIHGIDGRLLSVGEAIKLNDHIVYMQLPRNNVAGLLEKETEAMKLYRLNQATPAKEIKKLVVQPVIAKKTVSSATLNGYYLNSAQAENFTLTTYINNISRQAMKATVTLSYGTEKKQTVLHLPPHSAKPICWKMNILREFGKKNNCLAIINATVNGTELDKAILTFYPKPARKIYSVIKADAPIVIDGNKKSGEWDKAFVIKDMNCISDNSHTMPIKVSPEDFDAQARFLWNDFGLCFLIEVHDQKHHQVMSPALAWKQDSLQIALYQNNSGLDTNRFEWGFFLGQKGAGSITYSSSTGKTLSSASKIAITRDNKRNLTVYEGLLSWADLGSMNAIGDRANLRFRLSFIVNDSDGGERKWLEWSPGIACSKNPGEYPELILSPNSSSYIFRDDFSSGKLEPSVGWSNSSPGTIKIVKKNKRNVLELGEHKNASLKLKLPAMKINTPVTISMIIQASPINNSGFCLKTLLGNAEQDGYAVWMASNDMFGLRNGTKTGYILMDYNGKFSVAAGKPGDHVLTNRKLQKLIIHFDPATQIFKLFVAVDGKKRLLAEGAGKRQINRIDTFELRPSNWGAKPIIIHEITVSGTVINQ